jgi:O-antigen ligase
MRDLVILPFALAAFGVFYTIYVPLVPRFQAVLAPVLFLAFVLAAVDRHRGLFFFVFAFPLVNFLPQLFGIFEDIPRAPVALVLFFAFALGNLVNGTFRGSPGPRPVPLARPMAIFSALVGVSAAVTALRHMDFFPFMAPAFHELVVNAKGVRAGGAVMSDVFAASSALTGVLFFVILRRTISSWKDARKLVVVLSSSLAVSLAFALIQRYRSIALGNTPFWVELRQINGTFQDPNAFAAFLAGSLPLVVGAALASAKRPRAFLLGLVALGLFVIPATGSRSSFAALLVSGLGLAAVGFFRAGWSARKKALILAGAGILAGALFFLARDSILFERLRPSGGLFGGRAAAAGRFFNWRLHLWANALRMMGDFPMTGVGVGAFIVELPNYSLMAGEDVEFTDSALNYFLQAGAEMGVVGLLAVLWIFLEILKRLGRGFRRAGPGNGDRYLWAGAAAGIAAFLVNFQFHTYVGSFEVIYLFWMLVAILFLPLGEDDAGRAVDRRPGRKFRMAVLAVAAVFGIVHARNSAGPLSIPAATEKYGWQQDFGFYERETDPRGLEFRWAGKRAGLTAPGSASVLSLPVRSSHPRVEQIPVRTRVYLADRHFRKTRLLSEIVFHGKGWMDVDVPLPAGGGAGPIRLVFETDRTWRPSDEPGIMDRRDLAFALGTPRFR